METIITRYSKESIKERVETLAELITGDFKGEEIYLVGILRGAFVFLADLMRHISLPCHYDFIVEKMEQENILFSGDTEITNKNVILLKDVVTTGVIENYLTNQLKTLHPRTIRLACLIDKPTERKVDIQVDYTVFSTDRGIFVGYGMDYKGLYGNLPTIGTVKE